MLKRLRVEVCDQVAPSFIRYLRPRIAGRKAIERFPMREVESTLSCDKELPSNRWLGVKKCNRNARLGRYLGGAEACWPATDDGDRRVQSQADGLGADTRVS